MIERRLEARLLAVRRRLRTWYASLAMAVCWLSVAFVAGWLWWYFRSVGLDGRFWLGILATAAFVGTLVAWQWARVHSGSLADVARRLEARFPDLDARLLTAVEQCRQGERFSFLQEQVIRQALSHELRRRWIELVPAGRLSAACFLVVVSGALMVASLALIGQLSPPPPTSGDAALHLVLDEGRPGKVHVEPGDTAVEKDSPVLVTARFEGQSPLKAQLVVEESATGRQRRLEMIRSLDDPLFGARLDAVDQPLRYRVEYVGGASEWYSLTVFEYPRVVGFDARLVYPSYTNLPEKEWADVRRLTAVVGTELYLVCRVNKPLEKVRLVDRQGNTVVLEASAGDPLRYTGHWTLVQSERWTAQLTDTEGRHDKPPPAELFVQVTPNRPPELRWTTPGRDVRVSPLEELLLAGQASDDFGLARYGIVVQFGAGDAREIVLGEKAPGGTRQSLQYVLDFEAEQAQPDQLASYYWWAEDFDAQGRVRRVESDMYFAEVRPFEEIFREGQSFGEQQQQENQQNAGSPNASAAEQLADLQKEIINGTWKLKRSDAAENRPDEFRSDARLLAESQQNALAQLQQLGQQLQDTQSLGHFADAARAMQSAAELLERSAERTDAQSLLDALAPEKAAYEALLRLRAREHQVVRSRQRSSSSSSNSSNSRLQEQLNELQLRQDPNRYETERQAAPEEDPQQRELRRNLNRLRELARRQQDLNEQIRQLESALREAATEEERKALEQQLKRLRDEQQEILRDTEELQQRMEQQAQDGSLRQEQQQLEQTRENVRRASQALEEGRLSQALSEGTRAERQFRQLQDQLRQQAASQYSEAVRQLRQQARQIREQQQQIAEQMRREPQAAPMSLRDEQDQPPVPDQLRQQAERLGMLFDSMEHLVQQAEQDEPLLSRRLYDAYRDARVQQPQERLQQAAEWWSRGFPDQAQQPEEQARQTIDQLTQNIEQAAESVLGSELETLRRARQELEQALRELRGSRNTPDNQSDTQPQSDPMAESERQAAGQSDSAEQRQQQDSAIPSDQSGQTQENGGASPMQRASGARSPTSDDSPAQDRSRPDAVSGERPQRTGGQESPTAPEQPSDPQRQQDAQPGGRQRNDRQPNGQSGRGQQSDQPSEETEAQREESSGPSGGGDRERQPAAQDAQQSGGDNVRAGGDQWGGFRWTTGGPIWGDRFQEWADRLRDVEEMLDDPRWRAELSRVRDRARAMRLEFKRHSREPTWDLLRDGIERPLVTLRDQISEAIRRLDRSDRLAPVDHDPVPPRFDEQVRRYYERLGSGQR